ncbi:MAG TPA: response regulator transcription factor [Polyangia bacterium]
MPIRILLVDDNEMFRSALRALLESKPGLEVVGEAADAEQALGLLVADPDVVITDRYLPGVDGIEVAREIKERRPDIAVILLSGMEDPALVAMASAAGAAAVLNKSRSLANLIPTITRFAADKLVSSENTPGLMI